MNLTTYFKDFENFLKLERNLSVNTIKSYRSDLKKLEFYLSKTSAKKLSFIDPDIVRGFLYEQSKRVSAKTQGRIISTLKTFFNFLVLEKLINDSPIENIDYPKIDSKIPLVLSTDEIDKIISCAFSKKFGLRNQTIIEIMYSCGLRVSEVIEMKISNIFFDDFRKIKKIIYSKKSISNWWLNKENIKNRKKFLFKYAKCFKFKDLEKLSN